MSFIGWMNWALAIATIGLVVWTEIRCRATARILREAREREEARRARVYGDLESGDPR